MRPKTLTLCLALAFVLTLGQPIIHADEPNVGVLRVSDVKHPRQVAPSSHLSLMIDAEYAIRQTARIRASLFEGNIRNLGEELWHADPVDVTLGGDQVWAAELTAPSTERNWSLVAVAYFEEEGRWMFYNDTVQGPGYFELSIKIAEKASLEVQLSAPGIEVTVGETRQKTDAEGLAHTLLPVGRDYTVSVPEIVELQNSTRLVFNGWSDGLNSTQRTVLLDGDVSLAAAYRTQYLVQVTSPLSQYALRDWYDANSNVTLKVAGSVPAAWPFSLIGVNYVFKGWRGAAASPSTEINLTVNEPKALEADFALDLTPIVVPLILAVGIAGGVALAFLRRKAGGQAAAEQTTEEAPSDEAAKQAEPSKPKALCPTCGQDIEEEWSHCIKCGAKLR